MVSTKTVINSVYFALLIPMIVGSLGTCFFNNNKIERKISFVHGITMVLLAGLRWETGTDWKPYFNLFSAIDFNNIFAIEHHEIGYKFLNLLIKTICNNYTFFLIVISFIAIYLVYYIIVKSETNSIIAMQFFYTNYFLAHYLGSNRRIIAIGLGLCMIWCIYRNKNKYAIILFLLAISFHRTAIILIICFWIPKKQISNIKAISLICLFCIIGMTIIIPKLLYSICLLGRELMHWYMFTNAIWHLNNVIAEGGENLHNIFGILKRVIYICIFILFGKKVGQKSLYCYFFNIYLVSLLLYCVLVNIGTFAIMTTYLCIVEVILWGHLIKYSRAGNRTVLTGVVIMLGITQLINCFSGQYGDCFFPYKFVW